MCCFYYRGMPFLWERGELETGKEQPTRLVQSMTSQLETVKDKRLSAVFVTAIQRSAFSLCAGWGHHSRVREGRKQPLANQSAALRKITSRQVFVSTVAPRKTILLNVRSHRARDKALHLVNQLKH